MAKKILSKSLKRKDIEKRLAVPNMSLDCLPPLGGKPVVHVKDESGRVWKFEISTRKKSKYLKPVLIKGWRGFVCSKELRVGDIIAFYMEKEEEEAGAVSYLVRVKKAVKIFGAVVAHKPSQC